MAAPTVRWRSQQDVALPRALDPNKFAAAREPEVRFHGNTSSQCSHSFSQ